MDNKDVLGKVWGDVPRGTQGKDPDPRGARAVRAARAGVVVDVPVPQDVQAVFDDMKPAPDTRRAKFFKKYRVDSGVAQVTPEEFRSIINRRSSKIQFQNYGVDRILISDGLGLDATFVFFGDKPHAEINKMRIDSNEFTPSHLVINGITKSLGGQEKIVTAGWGVLYKGNIPLELAAHSAAAKARAPDSQHFWNVAPEQGNFSTVFKNMATAKKAVDSGAGENGVPIFVRAGDQKAIYIGTLIDAKRVAQREHSELQGVHLSDLKHIVGRSSYVKPERYRGFLSDIFGESKGLRISANGKDLVLLRPSDSEIYQPPPQP